MKWWLVSDGTIKQVVGALEDAVGKMNWGVSPPLPSRLQREALFTLESGCHETEAVPMDFYKQGPVCPACGGFSMHWPGCSVMGVDKDKLKKNEQRQDAITALFVLLRYIINTK